MAKIILTVFFLLFSVLLCLIGAYLAYNNIPDWGWFLFVGLIFGGVSADLINKIK